MRVWQHTSQSRITPAIKTAASTSEQSDPESEPSPQNPSVCAEERRSRRNRASDCLSEASSSSTPAGLSTAGCPQRSGGTQTVGSPFLLLTLLLAKQKKSESPAAATERHRDSAINLLVDSSRTLRQALPERRTGTATTFGIGRFRGRSTNFPCLRLALRVLRFASQRNCDPTPKTVQPHKRHSPPYLQALLRHRLFVRTI